MTRKRWEEHTPGWRARHAAAGETKARWNKYLDLSPETQRRFSVESYAAGEAIPVQRIERYKSEYRTTMYQELYGRKATVEKGIQLMTSEQLGWSAKASASSIQARGRSKDPKFYIGTHNVWWYK